MASKSQTTGLVSPEEIQYHPEPNLFSPDVSMLILTWVTFFLLLGILSKFAWKPILSALEFREAKIRKGVDDAEEAARKLATIEQERDDVLSKAEADAKQELERGRKAASEAAKVIEHKAKEQAQILVGNATHDIKAKTEAAQSQLRKESVGLAVSLAQKILEENLDEKKQLKLLEKYVKDFSPEKYNE